MAEELVEKFGPYNDSIDQLFMRKIIDKDTFSEEIRYRIKWIVDSVFYIMEKYSASLYMMHWHLIDKLQHSYLGLIDPNGGLFEKIRRKKLGNMSS